MIKKISLITLLSWYSTTWAANYVNLHQASVDRLHQLSSLHPQQTALTADSVGFSDLKPVSQMQLNKMLVTRYQQFYKGIPIFGAQITISKSLSQSMTQDGLVNGHLFDDVQLNTNPSVNSDQSLLLAKQSYMNTHPDLKTHQEKSELQIRASSDNQLQLVYLVSFKSLSVDNKPLWPFFIIDAHSGMILKQWDNVQNFSDTGPGGNEKVHEYWYGKEGLPKLPVSKKGQNCYLEDKNVRLVNLHATWDWEDLDRTPFKYTCNNNVEDPINGSFSVGNDAYYFGHTIVNLFKDWYDLNALQDDKGQVQKLIMRVHFGSLFENAFWDGETMTFGDGHYLYPLVSLDIAGHEVAHGFTQQHSGLEYHDQSGALNESFSDMAAQAARAYLLEKNPELYNRSSVTPNEVTWKIGETVIPPSIPLKAIRFMDLPSLDGQSADCLDKKMARSQNSICAISFQELLAEAEKNATDEGDLQSTLVHTASGVFNRAFYLMSQKLGIKTAFHIMLLANSKYWNPTSDFNQAACGVMDAAKDLNIEAEMIQSTFKRVGIDVVGCN